MTRKPSSEKVQQETGGETIPLPSFGENYHCIITGLFYGKMKKGAILRDEGGNTLAEFNTQHNLSKLMVMGARPSDGRCTLELTGVDLKEWDPLKADGPSTNPVCSRVYSYYATGIPDDRALITIVVQAGVLPDVLPGAKKREEHAAVD